jgi:hypothetical protein
MERRWATGPLEPGERLVHLGPGRGGGRGRGPPGRDPRPGEDEEAPLRRPRCGAPYAASEVRIRVEAARDLPEGTALLRGGRVITMRGDEVIENGEVLVRGHRIEAVGPAGSLDVPADARVIDVTGHTVVPGFVDTHAHLRPAQNLHREDIWIYQANLAYGVTTTRDPQTGTSDVLTYADLVEAGRMLGPGSTPPGPGSSGRRRSGTWTTPAPSSGGTASTGTRRPSRCTWPGTGSSASGSSWPPGNWSSCPPPRAP